MSELAAQEQVEIAAPAGRVWAYRLDFTNLPEYNPAVSGVERVAEGSGDGGHAGAGATYTFTLATPQGPHPVRLTVTAARTDHEVSAAMTGALSANEVFSVEPAGDAGCRAALTLWVDLPEGLAAETTARLLAGGRTQIRGELAAMKAVLEARPGR